MIRKGADIQDTLSFESCSSSTVVEDMEGRSEFGIFDGRCRTRRRPRLKLRGLLLQERKKRIGEKAGTRRGKRRRRKS